MDLKNKYIKKLELDEILSKLSDIAILDSVKEKINNLVAMNSIDDINTELLKVKEAFNIVVKIMRAPLYYVSNYEVILSLLNKGAVLDAIDLYQTVKIYETVKSNQKFLQDLINNKVEVKFYQELVNNLNLNESLYNTLIKTINENGEVLDDASPTLKRLRRQIAQIDSSLKQKLQELISANASKLSQSSIVLRDDCYCLAVKSEFKNHFKGVVHDISASNQTFFIEPLIASQMMSDKAKLKEEEKLEIYRILKELSLELAVEVYNLTNNYDIIKEIDFIFAKAVLAISYDGSMPKLNTSGYLNLVNARHPLLKVKKVIPNNVSFGNGYLGIIVTGPNTGGKTVLLKTVGLLCLMVKYGLLIPASPESNVMVFDQVFCDIGDDQSIANNLSTFSSHMNNITNIINLVTPSSLVLFDEIGSGTDPIEGSNLAKAILKYLINQKVSFITTTHYSDLKAFGFEHNDIINASMEFDQNTLSPTFVLKLGVSGSSNALNIASKLGLKREIIEDAEKMNATSHDDVKKLILKLEHQAKNFTEKTQELEELKKQTKQLQQEYQNKLANIDKEKSKILSSAQKAADDFVDKITKEALTVLDEAKKVNKVDTKLHKIIDVKHQVNNLSKTIEKPKKAKKVINKKISVGDDVYIESYDQYGVVEKVLKDGNYQVSIGNITLKLSKDELQVTKENQITKDNQTKISFEKSRVNVSMTLDLRGKRYEEARELLDKYIDDLMIVGLKQANIIHGFGTGVIRELVQNYLKHNSHVKSFRYGGENEGGFGVTVVTLK